MSKVVRQNAFCVVVVCLVVGFAATASAVPPEELLRVTSHDEFSGPCCFSFNESITVTEPAKPVPVVVTWEVHGFESSGAVVGLMLNGGPCTFYGSGSFSNFGDDSPRAFQWIVFPSDGLRAGSNTLTLCGGGSLITSGMTLAARLSN